MSTWGRAIEAGEPAQSHFAALQHLCTQDPHYMREAIYAAIEINLARANLVGKNFNAAALAELDPALAGLSAEQAEDLFITRMERNMQLLVDLGLEGQGF